MGFIDFVLLHKQVFIFYSVIILLIFLFRKKFEFQAKIVALYKTKFGIKFIDKIGTKYAELIKIIGYCGIGAAFFGIIFIFFVLVKGFFDLFFIPSAPPVVSPLLPGVKIPGIDLTVPLFEGWLVLFICILVHEFSHGIVAKAHGVKIHNTGIFFLGPLMGAFVEPDEKQVAKKGDVVEYSIIAAGPFSNAILAIIAVLMVVFVMNPLINNVAQPIGITFPYVEKDLPAFNASITQDTTYNLVNGQEIRTMQEFEAILDNTSVGQTITIGNALGNHQVVTTYRESNPSRAIIGVNVMTQIKEDIRYKVLEWIRYVLQWTYIISFGLGLGNLLPLGPIDGGRIAKTALEKIFGVKKGKWLWIRLSFFVLALLAILLFAPLFK